MAPFRTLLVFLLPAAALMAQEAGTDADKSPFLPPSVAANAVAGPSDPNALDLRGIMSTREGMKYNIYDPAKKSSVWVGVNEPGAPFVIKSADPQRDTVTLVTGGQQMVLTLKQAKVVAPAANGLPQGGVVLRPTPEDEQRRLQAVADEVRRRRLLREQAAAQQHH